MEDMDNQPPKKQKDILKFYRLQYPMNKVCYFISDQEHFNLEQLNKLDIGQPLSLRQVSKKEFSEQAIFLYSQQPSSYKSSIQAKLYELIVKNIANEKYYISELTSDLGVSRSTLHRILKKQTGKCTSHIINKIKLEQATVMLHTTEMNIAEIAYATGYSSPSYFVKLFHKSYGITPKSHRMRKKKQK